MTFRPDPATAYVLARLAELEAIQASGETISGRPSRGLILPPPDEDPDIAGRIARYRRWLSRHAKQEEHSDGRKRQR